MNSYMSQLSSNLNLLNNNNNYPMVFKSSNVFNDFILEDYMDKCISKKPIKVFSCLDAK